MAESCTSPQKDRVAFKEDENACQGSPSVSRHRATVRYNRKAVQKMLAIDEWIDGQLAVLYACSKSDVPVELSVDDVVEKEDGSEREEFIRSSLEACPAESSVITAFVTELLERMKKV